MNKIIIGLVGPIASGKGTVKKYLVEKYGAQDCRFSTILRDVLNRLSLETSRDNLIKVSTILREQFGQDLLAKVIANDAKHFTGDLVVIDGVRRMEDVKYLREVPGFVLVAIDAHPERRHSRLINRNENAGDDKKTYEEFVADHSRETEATIPGVMKTADLTIDNSGTMEELYAQVDKIVADLKAK
ncbi:MAG: AAA family ATPase [bacterium]